ncbi:hypothetical protein [Scytonema sp. NUACC26]|uniref:hypothetical protein n=1 Tax=Scytonema sp. NUACC26 TaxID=3140176 RepID=UPI0034DBC68A
MVSKKEALTNGFIFYFQGSYGVGKQTTAEALCHEFNMGLLVVDGDRIASFFENRPLNSEPSAFETTISLLCREASLQKAALYWKGFDNLLETAEVLSQHIQLEAEISDILAEIRSHSSL